MHVQTRAAGGRDARASPWCTSGRQPSFISISMKWAPSAPALSDRCSGLAPATSSAASRASSTVSACARTGGIAWAWVGGGQEGGKAGREALGRLTTRKAPRPAVVRLSLAHQRRARPGPRYPRYTPGRPGGGRPGRWRAPRQRRSRSQTHWRPAREERKGETGKWEGKVSGGAQVCTAPPHVRMCRTIGPHHRSAPGAA